MARISSLLQNCDIQKLPNRDRIQLALQFLHDNPTESVSVAAKIYHVKEDSVRTARRREQKRAARPKAQRGGQNKILSESQHAAVLEYVASCAAEGAGQGASKQMLYQVICYLKRIENTTKEPPSYR
jgi:transposase